MLGTALKQEGDLKGASAALKEAIRLVPGDPGPWNTLGQVLRAEGDLDGATRAFAEGTRLKEKKEKTASRQLRSPKTSKAINTK